MFTGPRCETRISFCQSVPCRNGATCIDTLYGYICQCAPGYTGPTCSNLLNVNYLIS